MNSAESEKVHIAATSDLHLRAENPHYITLNQFQALLHTMSSGADAIVLCGDITDTGDLKQVHEASSILRESTVPVFAVLGNHDHLKKNSEVIAGIFTNDGGVQMLQGQVYDVWNKSRRRSIRITGIEGGADGTFGPNPPPDEKKIRRITAENLERDLERLTATLLTLQDNHTLLALHYSPIQATIVGEEQRAHFLLGSTRLGNLIDAHKEKIAAVVHGHAHKGSPEGITDKGIPVYNVALQVLAKHARKTKKNTLELQDIFRVIEL